MTIASALLRWPDRFYPDGRIGCGRPCEELLDARGRSRRRRSAPTPKAIIAPHAGYQYSGPIAATAYASLAPAAGLVRRVIVAGPAHVWPVGGVAVPSVDAFATPLGAVVVDDDARRRALGVDGVVVDDAAHAERAQPGGSTAAHHLRAGRRRSASARRRTVGSERAR